MDRSRGFRGVISMILESLTRYFDTMCAKGELAEHGWTSSAKITFGLDVSEEGEVLRLIDLRKETTIRGKPVYHSRRMYAPASSGRSSNIAPIFLYDNASYILGIDEKDRLQCFVASKKFHKYLLETVDHPAARAIVAFFNAWIPEEATEHELLAPNLDMLQKGANIMFCFDGQPVTEIKEIRDVWNTYVSRPDNTSPRAQCLVTGEYGPVALTHPMIRDFPGAKSTGAALVSFNIESACSDGHKQNLNAPVNTKAAFAYTSALNYLVSNPACRCVVGNTTVLCWGDSADQRYQEALMCALLGNDPDIIEELLLSLDDEEGILWRGDRLNPDEPLSVLGIAPNSARLAIRFFIHESFGEVLRNIAQHYIDTAPKGIFTVCSKNIIPLWQFIAELKVGEKLRENGMVGGILHAILGGSSYPALLGTVLLERIDSEMTINKRKMALLKAYNLRAHPDTTKEIFMPNPNQKESNNKLYMCGQLLSIYEELQYRTAPDVGRTVKDKYFRTAGATPAKVMPHLNEMGQYYLKKLSRKQPGLAVYFEQRISELILQIGPDLPATVPETKRMHFIFGYYEQNAQRYAHKTKNTEEEPEEE